MKILGTGLTGLVGSRILELLKDKHRFENLSLSTGCDITDKEEVFTRISRSESPLVFHLAAKADVDGCENDRHEDQKMLGDKNLKEYAWSGKRTAWALNVVGTKNVVEACEENGKKIIYVSTDFVFDGNKEFYNEHDIPNPINWYAATKYEAEKAVQKARIPWLIMRISYPYRAEYSKIDFVRAVEKKLQEGKTLYGIKDHIMTPTFIDDIASALLLLIKMSSKGIFHVVGSQYVSPYDAAVLIAKIFGYDESLVLKTTRAEFFKNRAPRPFRLALRNDKILQLGLSMKTFEEGLLELKKQRKI